MRSKGSPIELEHRRRLAVRRLLDGYSTAAVADFLGVNERSVRRWFALFQRHGTAGLASQPVLGRPRKLSRTQEKIIWRWLADRPTAYGFSTELWTCARLSQLIQEEWDIVLNPHYLADWLRAQFRSGTRGEERSPGCLGPCSTMARNELTGCWS